jgi:hypothetical protein
MIKMDNENNELIEQEQIEKLAEEFDITRLQEHKFEKFKQRINNLKIKFEANKIQRKKDYGR